MKRILIYITLVVLVAAGSAYLFRSSPSADKPQGLTVVASGYVPYALARAIGGDEISLQMMLPPGAEPHAFEPTPGSLVTVHGADVFVYVSDKIEPWVKDVLGAAGKQTRVVKLADGLPPSDDPHVWMDFDNMRTMARTLAEVLRQVDPAHAALYQENLTRFENDIQKLDEDFVRVLARCERRDVIHVGHLAFSGLAKRYKLSLAALAGTSHEGEHSVQKLAEIVKLIRSRQIPVVFTEEEVSPRLAQTVAAETGAKLLPLYTVEHISKDDFNSAATYSDLMRRNLENLKQGLVCQL